MLVSVVPSASAHTGKDDNDTSAGQGTAKLANKEYRTGDLYSSIIYSRSSDVQSADGVEIPFSVMQKYPSETDDLKRYGLLEAPSGESPDSDIGGQLVSQFRTLYDYGWFEPLPQSEDNIISRVIQVVVDTVDKSVSDKATLGALNGAIFGASIFDAAAGVMQVLNDAVQWLNIPQLLGIVPGNESKGLLANMFRGAAGNLGINGTTFKTIQAFTLIAIALVCIMLTIFALRKTNNRRQHVTNLRSWWSRIVVAIMTVTVGALATGTVSSINANMNNLENMPNDLNQSYFVNTLDWAVYDNMDMSGINPQGKFNNDGSKSEDFEPTQQRVEALKDHIKASKVRYGVTGKMGANDTSATDMLNNFATGQTVTVKDYFDGIASIPCGQDKEWTGRWDIAKSGNGVFVCNRQGSEFSFSDFDAGWKNDGDFNSTTVTTPDFLAESSGDSDSKDGEDKDSKDSKGETTEYTIGSKKFKVPNNGPVKVRPINLNDPQSYIYGAIPSEGLSESTKSYANYIYNPAGQGFAENLNPETGEKMEANKDDEAARSIHTNALAIGIYNRYAGLSAKGMSDQSTAFFLQTKRSGPDSINYKGFYTSPNESGEAKNTGAYGNAFVHYTMPNTSPADFYGRIGSLTSIWASAGIISIATILILLRTPLLGAIVKSTKGFIIAFTTGNLIEFVRYVVYFFAYSFSMIGATTGIYLGVMLGKYLIADSALVQTLFGLKAAQDSATSVALGWVPVVGDVVEKTSGLAFLLPLFAVSLAFVAALVWPLFQTVRGDGSVRKLSVLGTVVNFPYMVAEALDSRVTQWSTAVYGKEHGQSSGFLMTRNRKNRAMANTANKSVKQARKDEKKAAMSTKRRVLGTGVKGAAKVGGALAVGGAVTAATGGAGAGVAGGLLTKALGHAGTTKAGRAVSGVVGNYMSTMGRQSADRRVPGKASLGGRLHNTAQTAFKGAESILRKMPGGEALIGEDGLYAKAVSALMNHDLRGRAGSFDSAYADRPTTGFSGSERPGAPTEGFDSPYEDRGPGAGEGTTGRRATFDPDSVRDENGAFPMGPGSSAASAAAGAATGATVARAYDSPYDLLDRRNRVASTAAASAEVPESVSGARLIGGTWVAADGSEVSAPVRGSADTGSGDSGDSGTVARVLASRDSLDLSQSRDMALPVSPSGEVGLPSLSPEQLARIGVPVAGSAATSAVSNVVAPEVARPAPTAGAVEGLRTLTHTETIRDATGAAAIPMPAVSGPATVLNAAASGAGDLGAASAAGAAAGAAAGLAGAAGRSSSQEPARERVVERVSERTTAPAPREGSMEARLAEYLDRAQTANASTTDRIENALRDVSGSRGSSSAPASSAPAPTSPVSSGPAPTTVTGDGQQMRVDLSTDDIRQMGDAFGRSTSTAQHQNVGERAAQDKATMRERAQEVMRMMRQNNAPSPLSGSDGGSATNGSSAATTEPTTRRARDDNNGGSVSANSDQEGSDS